MAKLTALSAKTLSKPGRHGDSDGLYLNIAPSGSKSWVQRIVIDGRRRDIGLGPYPAVSLARAREIAHGNRSAIAQGRDTIAEKREKREAGLRRAPSIPTFAEAAAAKGLGRQANEGNNAVGRRKGCLYLNLHSPGRAIIRLGRRSSRPTCPSGRHWLSLSPKPPDYPSARAEHGPNHRVGDCS